MQPHELMRYRMTHHPCLVLKFAIFHAKVSYARSTRGRAGCQARFSFGQAALERYPSCCKRCCRTTGRIRATGS